MSQNPEFFNNPDQNLAHTASEETYLGMAFNYCQELGRSALDAFGHRVLRGALAVGLLATVATSLEIVKPERAEATTTGFSNDYPYMNAALHSRDSYEWWIDENNDGKKQISPGNNDELMSPLGFDYRNCVDGAAYWAGKYLNVSMSGSTWKSASNWDDAARLLGYDVKSGNTNDVEPGDIAQDNEGTWGHVGFVTEVEKNDDGEVIRVRVAEMNKKLGEFTHDNYTSKNSSGKIIRNTRGSDWDHFIDLNGTGKGLNGEALDSSAGTLQSTAPTPSLLQNGGFEFALDNGKDPWQRSLAAQTSMTRKSNSTAREGNDYLVFNGANAKSVGSVYKDIETAIKPGDDYRLTAFVRSASNQATSGQARVYLRGQNPADASVVPFTAKPGQWAKVDVPASSSANHDQIRVQFTSGTGSTPGVEVDAVSLNRSLAKNGGFELANTHGADPWERNSNQTNWQRQADGTAYTGKSHLSFNGIGGNTGNVWKDFNKNIVDGETYLLTAQVRSASGSTNTHGQARIYLRGQHDADAGVLDFTASKNWKNIKIPVQATNNHDEIRTQFTAGTGNTPGVEFDGITIEPTILRNGGFEEDLSYGSDWVRTVNNTSWAQKTTASAAEGNRILEFNGTPGNIGKVWKDTANTIYAGDSRVLHAKVRSVSGITSGTARIFLNGSDNPTDVATVPFVTGRKWTDVTLPVQATKNHDNVRVEFVSSGATGGVQLDGISVTK